MEAIGKSYVNLGEGSSLFNLLTGKSVYTNPKTYKADNPGSFNDTERKILERIFGNTNSNNLPSYFKSIG